MIKEEFIKFISAYQDFQKVVTRIDTALNGKQTYSSMFWESDLATSVDKMLDAFLNGNFKEAGIDLIYWFLFENVSKTITEDDKDIPLNSPSDLWDYMIERKEFYVI